MGAEKRTSEPGSGPARDDVAKPVGQIGDRRDGPPGSDFNWTDLMATGLYVPL